MQWQHPERMGPAPYPKATEPPEGADGPTRKGADPLNSWREKAGWRLVIIGYYSKTLNEAQKNYPAFDKEAGAILLCVRHWADLITYHPTTVYTDSAVATSMLVKHAAPPRLQRWGVELGTFLPHLKIQYRRGADNGLADLLSRFPAFQKYVKARDDVVELPDDLFDYVGSAPLYTRKPCTRERDYLSTAAYELYELKKQPGAADTFWCSGGAPEIPGRGMKDRAPSGDDALGDSLEAMFEDVCTVSSLLNQDSNHPELIWQMLALTRDQVEDLGASASQCLDRWQHASALFEEHEGFRPLVGVAAELDADFERLRLEANLAGCTCVAERDLTHPPEVYLAADESAVPEGSKPSCASPRVEGVLVTWCPPPSTLGCPLRSPSTDCTRPCSWCARRSCKRCCIACTPSTVQPPTLTAVWRHGASVKVQACLLWSVSPPR